MANRSADKKHASPVWLVGHDLTLGADEVARAAASELAPHAGTMLLVHAYQVPVAPPIYAGAAISVPPLTLEMDRQVEQMAHKRLDDFMRKLKSEFPGVQFQIRVTQGPAAAALLALADVENVDRIVVGTHGRTGFRHFLLGSVAERVVRLANVPVLVDKQVGRSAEA